MQHAAQKRQQQQQQRQENRGNNSLQCEGCAQSATAVAMPSDGTRGRFEWWYKLSRLNTLSGNEIAQFKAVLGSANQRNVN